MKRVVLLLLLLLVAPLKAQANPYAAEFFLLKDRLPLKGTAHCKSAMTAHLYTEKLGSEICVVPKTFVKTAKGGRVLVVFASNHGTQPFYGAYGLDVNCPEMEKRSVNAWGFTTEDYTNNPNSYIRSLWERTNGVSWHIHASPRWGAWEPITYQDGVQKWICSR